MATKLETTAAPGRYAPVNGLSMYYEIYGAGRPLVLLHGAFMTIESSFQKMLPTLAETRQVIAVEQQAHGRTADIDRPLTYGGMAADTVALLRHLGIKEADVFGYSMGAAIALESAVRHPVRGRLRPNGAEPGGLACNDREGEATGPGVWGLDG